ncbi:enoyl-CoA hydratase [Cladophialophora yegresii CBS 114405]|uniref:Enoyl-CoA hydratase n=1 Tax=Cladophialophora yegresii CBS 114405 TaxID=1182544 RepID=W9WGZ2_9EURO|nr:enoyl-CoA hydratase [Cladophialophora yegresii CBS 114405]EXJ63851.1 enoyl-CoA hydratase [Cladophialophora yegresii CBS 114405]
MSSHSFSSILYGVAEDQKVATIAFKRPRHFNAIDPKLPGEIRAAVRLGNGDAKVHCIIIKGNGPGFCGGCDLNLTAEQGDVSKGFDPFIDYQMMKEYTESYAELLRSHKPTIAQVHGAAVAGGSGIALSCDLVIMAEDARIGYTPTRVWGCPRTAMWTYRLGPEKSKRMLFTGDLVNGKEAESMDMVLKGGSLQSTRAYRPVSGRSDQDGPCEPAVDLEASGQQYH